MKLVVRMIALSTVPYAARQRIEIATAKGRRRIVDAISGMNKTPVPATTARRPRIIVAAQYSE
jgi:hypothetical protein